MSRRAASVRLPHDYARCGSADACALAARCARHLAPGRLDGPQVYSMFPGGADCYGFVPVEQEASP